VENVTILPGTDDTKGTYPMVVEQEKGLTEQENGKTI
jgi:hypothetical protein